MVFDRDVQGVVIATPAETHYDLARRALEAGKDVFVEKQLALTYEEGGKLVRLAESYGRRLLFYVLTPSVFTGGFEGQMVWECGKPNGQPTAP